MLNPISESNQNKLVSALSTAMDYYNSGSTPSEAVAKSAAENGFNSNYTRRCTEMFNAAVTLDHYNTYHMNAEKRASSFPLANFQDVWQQMAKHASVHKKAKQQPRLGVKDYSNNILPAPVFDWGLNTKSASVEEAIPEEDGTLTTTIRREQMMKAAAARKYAADSELREAKAKRIREKRASLKAAADAARFQYFADKEKLTDAMDYMASKFKRLDAPEWGAFCKAANNMYPNHTNWLNYMKDRYNLDKRDTVNTSFMNSMGIKTASRIDDLGVFHSTLEAFGTVVKHIDTAAKSAFLYKKANLPLLGLSAVGALPEVEYNKKEKTDFKDRMRRIKGNGLLARLYLEDPVIGAAGHDAVKRIYSEIAKIEPNAATQAGTMRAYLRRAVDSSPIEESMGLDTADIKQLKETYGNNKDDSDDE